MFLHHFFADISNNGNDSVSLWTIMIILIIIALLVFIFRNVRR